MFFSIFNKNNNMWCAQMCLALFANLDKCIRIYHSKSKGFDQKRPRIFTNIIK